MKVFGRNEIDGSDSHENGKREIGNIIIWLKVIFSWVLNPNSNVHYGQNYNKSDN